MEGSPQYLLYSVDAIRSKEVFSVSPKFVGSVKAVRYIAFTGVSEPLYMSLRQAPKLKGQ